MRIVSNFQRFIDSESGAITVDWVVLTAGVTGMAIASTAMIGGGISHLSSELEAQLRNQQISDNFVQFRSSDFDALYDETGLTESAAEEYFNTANDMTNAEIIEVIENAMEAISNGDITDVEMAELVAAVSVADQRNIIDVDTIQLAMTN